MADDAKGKPDRREFAASSSASILSAAMERWSAAIETTKSASMIRTVSIPPPALAGRKLLTNA